MLLVLVLITSSRNRNGAAAGFVLLAIESRACCQAMSRHQRTARTFESACFCTQSEGDTESKHAQLAKRALAYHSTDSIT